MCVHLLWGLPVVHSCSCVSYQNTLKNGSKQLRNVKTGEGFKWEGQNHYDVLGDMVLLKVRFYLSNQQNPITICSISTISTVHCLCRYNNYSVKNFSCVPSSSRTFLYSYPSLRCAQPKKPCCFAKVLYVLHCFDMVTKAHWCLVS